MKYVKTFESFVNESKSTLGRAIKDGIKSLSKSERNELRKLSMNVIDRAKKAGFQLYVNYETHKSYRDTIEFCIKHNHDNVEGSAEYNFMHTFKYRVDFGVNIGDKMVFDITTGSWSGQWDEYTIDIDTYLDILGKK